MGILDRFRPLTPGEFYRIKQEIIDRCDHVGDCWVYRNVDPTSYGMKYIQGKMRTVSRFMLACSTVQSLDIKLDACHVRECPYKACCNPEHLFWGSHRENCKQREQEKREIKRRSAALPPVPLGHVTHEENRDRVEEQR